MYHDGVAFQPWLEPQGRDFCNMKTTQAKEVAGKEKGNLAKNEKVAIILLDNVPKFNIFRLNDPPLVGGICLPHCLLLTSLYISLLILFFVMDILPKPSSFYSKLKVISFNCLYAHIITALKYLRFCLL